MRRWTCPTCNTTVHAPERPRRDDVRRYCLPCSQRSGRLVERRALAAERERAAKAERADARRLASGQAAKAAEQDRLTMTGVYLAEPVHLPTEAKRLWNLSTLRGLPRWRRDLPHIDWRRSAHKVGSSGVSYGHRIVVTRGSDPAAALATLLHELVHAALPSGEHHSARYWSMLRSAAKEAWPEADWSHFATSHPKTAWQKQAAISYGLRTWLQK